MVKRLLVVAAVGAATLSLQGCPVAILAGGVGAAALISNDRRTGETLLADERIEWSSSQRLRQSGQWESLNLNITSYNRMVLLTGQAANEQARRLAEKVVSEIPGVRGVTNEVTVASFSNFGARSQDSLTTTQVKARLVNSDGVNPGHVKVVTEAGVVYLLGLVTTKEADHAANVAATTAGVNKVVKVFEYITEAQATELIKPGDAKKE
jgi:osmotically-inducible protein OsmY